MAVLLVPARLFTVLPTVGVPIRIHKATIGASERSTNVVNKSNGIMFATVVYSRISFSRQRRARGVDEGVALTD